MTKNQKKFLAALESSLGVVTTAASKSGITARSHYLWMANSPEYKEAVEAARNRADDLVESKLFELIRKGDTAATIFYCKTRLKHRGYTEKTDVDITTGGKPIDTRFQIEIIRHREQVEGKEEENE